MNIQKRFLVSMNRCYAASQIVVGGQSRVLLATEGEGPCVAWAGPAYDSPQTVWDGPGGTMSMVPIPGTDGEFLAVQKFLKMYLWDQAKVVHVRPGAEGYAVTDLLHLPYIHRFDLLPSGGRLHFIGCTLSTHKESKEDWSHPGQVWVGAYEGPHLPLQVRLLRDGLTQNHGYSRLQRSDGPSSLLACAQGAFEVTPPRTPDGDWVVRQFMDWPISDIAAIDIDGDGELEVATIEPFHGCWFRVYKRTGGTWARIFEHPEVSDFYHVVVADTLRGEPVFIGGCRRGRQQLFALRASRRAPLEFEIVTIDEGVGPSNVHVVHERERDLIVAANREKAEGALYVVT